MLALVSGVSYGSLFVFFAYSLPWIAWLVLFLTIVCLWGTYVQRTQRERRQQKKTIE